MKSGKAPQYERDKFYEDMAQILGRGYTLTASEVREIVPYYGYSKSGSGDVINNTSAFKALSQNGVVLVIESYKGSKIYMDGSLEKGDTDLTYTHQKIDERVHARSQKSKLSRR